MVLSFLKANWPELTSALIALVSVIGGLFAHLSTKRQERVEVNLSITEAHQALWGRFLGNPSLMRVTSDVVDIRKKPVTAEEEAFVLLLLAHLSTTLIAIREGKHSAPDGMLADVTTFYSKPVPLTVLKRHFKAQPTDIQFLLKGLL